MDNLYAKDQNVSFDALFANPTSLYRDTPFWAWNCALTEEELRWQIGIFQEMGMGGFHMHSRTGTVTPYLSADFMKLVDDCVDEAKKRGMLAWLYDEDRWPSGAAGGIVTKDPKFRARHLHIQFHKSTVPVDAANDNSGRFLAAYLIKLDGNGCLASYKRCGEDDPKADGEIKIWCYLRLSEKSGWFNDQCYVDTFNRKAIEKFVEVTHEAYYAKIGSEFGKTVPAVFTDEPQFTRKGSLTFAREEADVELPYTDDFPETYKAAYGTDFFASVPELLWELPDGRYSLARYRYHDHAAERFAHSFADTIGDWCRAHNIQSSGHMMNEPSLLSQTMSLGDCMRSYRSFLLPGIDMLCDKMELSTAKQAQSASRQFGRGGVLSELDGVTDWDFPFLGHKAQGDWQAAMGITVRVPHLSWVSMAGESKRDYPASISYQSPWYKKYPIIADHFARVNTAMTRGKAVSRIAVVHPVESYWLLYGPKDQTAAAREQAENDFSSLFYSLLFGLLDFDLLAESLLPGQNVHVEGKDLAVGEMRYSTVVVPPCITLRSTTLEYLENFRRAGGEVIFAGEVAGLCDAVPSDRAAKLAAQCKTIPYTRAALIAALEHRRDIRVLNVWNGYPADQLLYQMRAEGPDTRYLFIADTQRYGGNLGARVQIRGVWQLELLDTFTGTITPLQSRESNGWTEFTTDFHPHGHMLLRLTKNMLQGGASFGKTDVPEGEQNKEKIAMGGREELKAAASTFEGWIKARISGREVPVTLDEPNVYLLDLAQWRVNGGEWQKREEILRLDGYARKKLGVPPKSSVQPWAAHYSDRIYGTLDIRYEIEAAVSAKDVTLALEQPETSRIFLDGKEIPFADLGFWTDKCLRRTRLGDLAAGTHELIISREYTERTNVERAYLLGDFGVSVRGDECIVTAPVRTLHWGDIAPQGLPFYGGNITYHTEFTLDSDLYHAALHFPVRQDVAFSCYMNAREIDFCAFRGTLVSAVLDGAEAGDIAFAPFTLDIGVLKAGVHKLDLKLYGNRQNAFGACHLANRIEWTGPYAWRTEGDLFSYDYLLAPLGIMRSPFIIVK